MAKHSKGEAFIGGSGQIQLRDNTYKSFPVIADCMTSKYLSAEEMIANTELIVQLWNEYQKKHNE